MLRKVQVVFLDFSYIAARYPHSPLFTQILGIQRASLCIGVVPWFAFATVAFLYYYLMIAFYGPQCE